MTCEDRYSQVESIYRRLPVCSGNRPGDNGFTLVADRVFKLTREGAFFLPQFLAAKKQVELCELVSALAPFGHRNSTQFLKTRWMSLGIHYDWSERKYIANATCPLPEELKNIGTEVARLCGLRPFVPDAALVNFYHPSQRASDRLGGHKDDAETRLDSPLVVLSFGPPACFLLGGATRDVEPLPILVQSGDILVLSGESRLAFHGVPRVWPLESSGNCSKTKERTLSEDEFPSGEELIAHTRVSISLRES